MFRAQFRRAKSEETFQRIRTLNLVFRASSFTFTSLDQKPASPKADNINSFNFKCYFREQFSNIYFDT